MTSFLRVLLAVCLGLPGISHAQNECLAMSYNIRYDNPGDQDNAWPVRKDLLIDQILFYEPDVLGIQEGLHHQVEAMQQRLTDYQYVGVGRDDGHQKGEYSAIFFKKEKYKVLESGTFWLSETPDTVSTGWDAALPRICTFVHLKNQATQDSFWVFNTHFDHIGEQARLNSSKLILEQIKKRVKGEHTSLLLGDFNSTPDSPAYALLSGTLKDASQASETGHFGPVGTFNGFEFHQPVEKQIDYVFSSPNTQVKKQATLSDSVDCHYPSDHLPVLALIQWL
ncbi:MAG: endonuclease/exonuclease/phosphatase family protein [Saprospiraceae bacterium]